MVGGLEKELTLKQKYQYSPKKLSLNGGLKYESLQ